MLVIIAIFFYIIVWLTEKGISPDFEMLPVNELDEHLRRFYAELRTTDGKMYSRATFCGICAAINCYITAPPFNRPISLMDNEFHRSMLCSKPS